MAKDIEFTCPNRKCKKPLVYYSNNLTDKQIQELEDGTAQSINVGCNYCNAVFSIRFARIDDLNQGLLSTDTLKPTTPKLMLASKGEKPDSKGSEAQKSVLKAFYRPDNVEKYLNQINFDLKGEMVDFEYNGREGVLYYLSPGLSKEGVVLLAKNTLNIDSLERILKKSEVLMNVWASQKQSSNAPKVSVPLYLIGSESEVNTLEKRINDRKEQYAKGDSNAGILFSNKSLKRNSLEDSELEKFYKHNIMINKIVLPEFSESPAVKAINPDINQEEGMLKEKREELMALNNGIALINKNSRITETRLKAKKFDLEESKLESYEFFFNKFISSIKKGWTVYESELGIMPDDTLSIIEVLNPYRQNLYSAFDFSELSLDTITDPVEYIEKLFVSLYVFESTKKEIKEMEENISELEQQLADVDLNKKITELKKVIELAEKSVSKDEDLNSLMKRKLLEDPELIFTDFYSEKNLEHREEIINIVNDDYSNLKEVKKNLKKKYKEWGWKF